MKYMTMQQSPTLCHPHPPPPLHPPLETHTTRPNPSSSEEPLWIYFPSGLDSLDKVIVAGIQKLRTPMQCLLCYKTVPVKMIRLQLGSQSFPEILARYPNVSEMVDEERRPFPVNRDLKLPKRHLTNCHCWPTMTSLADSWVRHRHRHC